MEKKLKGRAKLKAKRPKKKPKSKLMRSGHYNYARLRM